jgi:hypothetical protein
MKESRYVNVECDVLCFEADLMNTEGDAAMVGLVIKYVFWMTMAGKAAAIHVVLARMSA